MEAVFDSALKGLIAAGPMALLLGVAVYWLVGQLKVIQDENAALRVKLSERDAAVVKAKDDFTIELLKAKDEHSQERVALYERVMTVLNHLGGEK